MKWESEWFDWLIENTPKYDTVVDAVKEFNVNFNLSYKVTAVYAACFRAGIKLKPKLGVKATQFNDTDRRKQNVFKKGEICTWKKDGRLRSFIRLNDDIQNTHKNYRISKYWQPYEYYVWLNHGGRELKKNEFIYFKNGNSQDFNINNLCVMTKKRLATLNNEQLLGVTEIESFDTAMKCAELIEEYSKMNEYKELKRKQKLKKCRERYHQRKSEGICVGCGNPRGRNGALCDSCRLNRIRYNAEVRKINGRRTKENASDML